MMVSNRILLFQGLIFRCYISFREGTNPTSRNGWMLTFSTSPFNPSSRRKTISSDLWKWMNLEYDEISFWGVLTYFQGKKPWTMLVSGKVSWFLWDAHVGKYTIAPYGNPSWLGGTWEVFLSTPSCEVSESFSTSWHDWWRGGDWSTKPPPQRTSATRNI